MKLGCIGDDFTGSGDLANTLAKQGMAVELYCGQPVADARPEVEAGVIALKSRTIAPADAIAQSLAALEWLKTQGCTQFLFKYCSTFDSTAEGNIGPVTEALADALNASHVILCPAFPGTGRSVYQGHLFVNDVLLNASGMQDHPLTPMKDPDIRRVLAAQSKSSVGHVGAEAVFAGPQAIRTALDDQHRAGHRLIIVDAIRDEDLMAIGQAAHDLPLITGGSGIAMGLPGNFGCTPTAPHWTGQDGPCAILSGSCSRATRVQVALHAAKHPAFEIEAGEIINGTCTVDQALDWVRAQSGLPLVFTSADPAIVAEAQSTYGTERAAAAIEGFFANLALSLRDSGITRLITAGGETSGAVVEGLGFEALEIGPEIDPGVPALRAGPELVLALKSGNFGTEDFFEKAAKALGT